MSETAIAHALKKSGINTNAARLRSVAVEELRKSNRNISRALGPFVAQVREAGGIMAELVPEATTRHFAYDYLAGVIADMRGEGLKVPAKAGDGVQEEAERQEAHGPVENSEGEGSVRTLSGRHNHGPSPSDPVPSKDGGGVHRFDDSQEYSGSPENREGEAVRDARDNQQANGLSSSLPVRNGAVRMPDDNRSAFGRVVPIPNKPRGLEAMKARAEVHSVFDSYKTRDGIPIGDVVWSALPRLESANAREAALLKLIREHVTPLGNPNARVRDLIKVEDLQRMVQKAAEMAQ